MSHRRVQDVRLVYGGQKGKVKFVRASHRLPKGSRSSLAWHHRVQGRHAQGGFWVSTSPYAVYGRAKVPRSPIKRDVSSLLVYDIICLTYAPSQRAYLCCNSHFLPSLHSLPGHSLVNLVEMPSVHHLFPLTAMLILWLC